MVRNTDSRGHLRSANYTPQGETDGKTNPDLNDYPNTNANPKVAPNSMHFWT